MHLKKYLPHSNNFCLCNQSLKINYFYDNINKWSPYYIIQGQRNYIIWEISGKLYINNNGNQSFVMLTPGQ